MVSNPYKVQLQMTGLAFLLIFTYEIDSTNFLRVSLVSNPHKVELIQNDL